MISEGCFLGCVGVAGSGSEDTLLFHVLCESVLRSRFLLCLFERVCMCRRQWIHGIVYLSVSHA